MGDGNIGSVATHECDNVRIDTGAFPIICRILVTSIPVIFSRILLIRQSLLIDHPHTIPYPAVPFTIGAPFNFHSARPARDSCGHNAARTIE